MASKAVASGVKFAYDNAAANWMRKFSWNYLWGGREYGLQFHDTYFEPAPEVTEALRRLNLKVLIFIFIYLIFRSLTFSISARFVFPGPILWLCMENDFPRYF